MSTIPAVTFTPFQGLMNLARTVAKAVEEKTGQSLPWDGPDGLESVTADVLRNLGVPEHPVQLSAVTPTPRAMAEQLGVLPKRRAPKRRAMK